MSKKQNSISNKKPQSSVNNAVLWLVVLLCLVTLFVVIKQQSEIEHLALMQRIDTLKAIGGR